MSVMFIWDPAFPELLEHSAQGQECLAESARIYADEVNSASPTRKVQFEQQGAAIVTYSPIYHIVEWGSINNQPYRYFEQAADRAGLKYKEHGVA